MPTIRVAALSKKVASIQGHVHIERRDLCKGPMIETANRNLQIGMFFGARSRISPKKMLERFEFFDRQLLRTETQLHLHELSVKVFVNIADCWHPTNEHNERLYIVLNDVLAFRHHYQDIVVVDLARVDKVVAVEATRERLAYSGDVEPGIDLPGALREDVVRIAVAHQLAAPIAVARAAGEVQGLVVDDLHGNSSGSLFCFANLTRFSRVTRRGFLLPGSL